MRNLVVGIDGSAASHVALEWAARAVGDRGRIHAVTATDPEPHIVLDPLPTDDVEYRIVLERELARTWIEPARRRVGTVTAEVADGEAPEALARIAAARDSDAIVVGSHVTATGVPRLVGRTIRHLLADLRGPLVVVPTSLDAAVEDGPIIVGIGHSEATEASVRWAAGEAAQSQRALGLVRATREGPVFQVDGMLELIAYYIDPAKREQWVAEDLAELAALAQDASVDEIAVATTAVAGLPATTLVAQSEAASLLVIGHNPSKLLGRQHVTQPLRHALTHARCPVVVVPGGEPTG